MHFNILLIYQYNLQNSFKRLDPNYKVELLIKLMPFIYPKEESENFNLNEPLDFDF